MAKSFNDLPPMAQIGIFALIAVVLGGLAFHQLALPKLITVWLTESLGIPLFSMRTYSTARGGLRHAKWCDD